jgi:hypothetical protein
MNINKEEKKAKEEKLEKIKKSKALFVGTPVHSEVSLHFMKSCLDLQKECLLNNTNISFQLMKSSLVTQGRNLCVSAFLESNADHFLFIDSDISFSVRSIYRLFQSPYEVTFVAYPMKTIDADKFKADEEKRPDDAPNTKGLIFPVELMNTANIDMKDGFIEVEKGPTGCMMIKRSAFEKLIKAHPELKIKQQTYINGKAVDRPNYYNFFDTYFDPVNKTYSGEDFYFCKIWKELGEKIYCIADEEIGHVGEHIYAGKLIQEFVKLPSK